jgi:ATP/ADP translocase
MIIPVINLVSQCVCLFFPAMPVATASFGIFKCLDYSLFRTSKEILYIPLSYDARYRVKQVVDAFTNRFSKGASAFVFSGLYAAGVSISASVYPMIGVVASAIWLKAASLLRKD